VLYVVFQILWFLVAAAAIGLVVGWLCRSAVLLRRREGAAMHARAAQGDLEGQREQLEARLAEATSARTALQEELAQARQTAEADAKARRKLEREHSSTLLRLEAREREVARLGAELGAKRSQSDEPQPLASQIAATPLETAQDDADAPSPLTSRNR
jgi:flagellar biosynthesis/type III secretory pathway M-ring protein FliF/YscJ